jgi:serine/threonine-protein kinase
MLREHRQMEIDDTVRIVRDACHGLDYAHRAGVVHRDVKPGNLLLVQETGATKLADFGIAKAAEQTRITQVGSVLGTAAYLSPEQAAGEEAGPASDIYSLGVCAYQFLTGRLPHEYTSLTELALKQQQEGVEPITVHRPEVPRELDQAIRLALEREPERRYGSALQMAQAIEAGHRGDATAATRALAATDAGRGVSDLTAATQALRTRAEPARQAPARAPQRRRERAPARRRGRRMGAFLALLAVIAAIAAVGIALLAAGDDGSQRIDSNDARQQIQQLRDFLERQAR